MLFTYSKLNTNKILKYIKNLNIYIDNLIKNTVFLVCLWFIIFVEPGFFASKKSNLMYG